MASWSRWKAKGVLLHGRAGVGISVRIFGRLHCSDFPRLVYEGVRAEIFQSKDIQKIMASVAVYAAAAAVDGEGAGFTQCGPVGRFLGLLHFSSIRHTALMTCLNLLCHRYPKVPPPPLCLSICLCVCLSLVRALARSHARAGCWCLTL
jgi:hypothetical protein